VRLRSERYDATFLDPRQDFATAQVPLEVRWDPLTGRTTRLLPEGSIPPPALHDLEELAEQTRATCPFCADAIERETPRFPPELLPEGRIRRGEAVLFPNLVPYAPWSSVSVYSPERHRLALDELTPTLLADNLATQVEFGRAVAQEWFSINANHLPPAGSSVFHPHLQGAAGAVPTNAQRELAEAPVAEYVALERDGERHIASRGGVDWFASFAPAGIGEVRAFALDAELDHTLAGELARGIVDVLQAYAELGFESFNFALTGSPPTLRMVARAYFGPARRSDVMWSERLHGEVATDLAPERLAVLVRRRAAQ
jgi:UDPglucose--hexose-1-phosphate uridylyltransferase